MSNPNLPPLTKIQYTQQLILTLRQFLLSTDPGVTSMTFEGKSITYDRKAAIEELRALEREEATLLYGSRKTKNIDLTNAF